MKKNIVIKTPRFRKIRHYSEMQNDAWMHREGLRDNTIDHERRVRGYVRGSL